jgi:anti-sigma factor RsiW
MNERLPPEIQDLHAYVDGELGPEARSRIETRLEQDPQASDTVAAYRRLDRRLHELFDPVLAEPVPAPMRQPARRQRPAHRMRALAAGVLLLAGGVWLGAELQQHELLGSDAAAHVVRDAASAFAVYTPEVRHPVEVAAEEAPHLSAWLSKRLSAKVLLPQLEGFGYALVGGRLLATNDGPGALIMYENAEGERLVLYLCENDLDGRSTSLRFAQEAEKSVFYWFDGAFSFAVVAELERPDLLSIAKTVYRTYQG